MLRSMLTACEDRQCHLQTGDVFNIGRCLLHAGLQLRIAVALRRSMPGLRAKKVGWPFAVVP